MAIRESWIRFQRLGVGGVRKQTKTHQRPFLSHLGALQKSYQQRLPYIETAT
jgi:hypothetical protein